jgi:hypothetical protein
MHSLKPTLAPSVPIGDVGRQPPCSDTMFGNRTKVNVQHGGKTRKGGLERASVPRSLRLLTIILFACALALRAWVPAGWMPTPGAHNFAIMPCPGADGPTMDMGQGPKHQGPSKASGDCFAPLLAGAALPSPPLVIPAPSLVSADERSHVLRAIFIPSRTASRPYSTGPPEVA